MRLKKSSRFGIFLFAAVLATVLFEPSSHANSLKDQAEEYRDKGYSAQISGDIDNAAAFYQKAVAIDPAYAAAYNDLGVIFEMRGDTDRAEDNYLQALALDSAYLPAYSNLAYLYERKGNPLKAAFYWQKRIDRGSPDDPWTNKAKDNLKRLSEKSRAVRDVFLQEEATNLTDQILQRKIDEFSRKITLAKEHLEKGLALYDKKEFALALEELKKAQVLTPKDKNISRTIEKASQALVDSRVNEYVETGLKYYQAGETTAARREFKKLLAIIPASNQK
jgi:Flp pilus assembly protein TadD